MQILKVAVPGPFLEGLYYSLPDELSQIKPGTRVWVPLGRRKIVGLVLGPGNNTDFAPLKLKAIMGVIDSAPLFSPTLLKLLQWLSHYYQSTIGDVLYTAMPSLLCQGDAFVSMARPKWRITENGMVLSQARSAPKQMQALALLKENLSGLTREAFTAMGIELPVIKALMAKALISEVKESIVPKTRISAASKLILNPAQAEAFNACCATLGKFSVKLLEGVTGSGKTEIYLQLIAEVLARGEQALVLVPEIGLTPQMLSRFEDRFKEAIVILHSNLSEQEKLQNWCFATNNQARIIIGTRSAIFVPCFKLGVIIVDEEHDASFKQQSGVRYCARDVAIVRAQIEGIPIVLGSATPTLESLYNVEQGKFEHLHLPARAGLATYPRYHIIDMRQQPLVAGLSRPLLMAMEQHLAAGNQVLLFLNRRGYAPVLMCHACGWTAACAKCDAYLTLYQRPSYLSCHHCGTSHAVYKNCQACEELDSLIQVGVGTERIEEALEEIFKAYRVVRLDRSNVQRKGELERLLAQVHQGRAQILVGTQMLAKGHHFENVTMVGVVNIDGGLFSSDFRALEHTGQLLLQVAGRAGRVEKQGDVYIQTHHPKHPAILSLLEQGYGAFAEQIWKERKAANWPPFSYLAILRAEAHLQLLAVDFLNNIRELITSWQLKDLTLMGPVPALMQRKGGLYRMQLLFRAKDRRVLQACLNALHQHLLNSPPKKIRLHIDVDPIEIG